MPELRGGGAAARKSAAAEKREILARLENYCGRRGLGAAQAIAEASRGRLDRDTVLQMRAAGKFPIETWRALAKALARAEQDGAVLRAHDGAGK